MSLAPGVRLGPYEIHSAIGAGGMGEVWRARDTVLGRDVAIKILPDHLALDVDRLARFKREAQILASLNHPNIAAIYGFQESDGIQALVLELVEGPTLADRLAQGPLPLKEALLIAKQIAEAVEGAHNKNIIHRDLKPANIKIADRRVKVLDFGLAKALTPEGIASASSQLPTVITIDGDHRVMGTPSYMSPEQVRGELVDRAADNWAFGCVLFEMITGSLAFSGKTVYDTLGAVLQTDPPWDSLPPDTPLPRRDLLRMSQRLPQMPTTGARAEGHALLHDRTKVPWQVFLGVTKDFDDRPPIR